MKIKKYLILILFLFASLSVIAQYDYPEDTEESEEVKNKKKGWYRDSKLFFGGYFGLSFGTYTYIELAPIVGYRIVPRLAVGLGPKYMYIKERSYYETSVYGIKTFAQFAIFKNINETINIGIGDIFIYAENESLNIEPMYWDPYTNTYIRGDRGWVNITLIGGGLRFPIGERAGFSIMVLWDVSQNPYYQYTNPEIRLSFEF
jgi:hypothetical protein